MEGKSNEIREENVSVGRGRVIGHFQWTIRLELMDNFQKSVLLENSVASR